MIITVQDLIEQLKKHPKDYIVSVTAQYRLYSNCRFSGITTIQEITIDKNTETLTIKTQN